MALTLVEGVGNINAKKLLAYCGDFTSVFSSSKAKLSNIPGVGTVLINKIFVQLFKKKILERVEQMLKFIYENVVQLFLITDKSYPINLKQCEDSPIVLYGQGNLNFNNSKIVSVVGTRKVTQRGKDICTKMLEELKNLLFQKVFSSNPSLFHEDQFDFLFYYLMLVKV